MSGADGPARPVLGVTTYLQQARTGVWDVPASFLQATYLRAVTNAGGIALLLPPQPVDVAVTRAVLDRVDGLVLTGGPDIDPARYGQPPHPRTNPPPTLRDDWEFTLVTAALARRMPVLGICRGAQVLNVVLGGTLHQHLPDAVGHDGHQLGDARYATTAVDTVPGTRTAALLGARTEGECYHHQAVDRLGDGLIVSGTAVADGVVEAFELDPARHGGHWVVGVQWHPEERFAEPRLFAGIVAAAREYAKGSVTA